MATLRGSSGSYSIGSAPPEIIWTVVRGDTASFKVYVTDDTQSALYVPDWEIEMDIKRNDLVVVTLSPEAILDPIDDEPIPGEFLVKLTSAQSDMLQTGDIFDIQMTNISEEETSVGYGQVWTVAKGSMSIIGDVTR
jgi:hypothetical protein